MSCPPADVVTSLSAAFSGELPVLSSTTIIELNSSVYDLDESYVNGKTTMLHIIIMTLLYMHVCMYAYNYLCINT